MRFPGGFSTCLVISLLVIQSIPVSSSITCNKFAIECSLRNQIKLPSEDIFILNRGQIPCSDVVLYSQDAYFTPDGVIIRIRHESKQELNKYPKQMVQTPDMRSDIIKMDFLGQNMIMPIGLNETEQKCNYYVGNDPSAWVTNVPCYTGIVYRGLYNNIDLMFNAVQDGLKYNFIVHPGGDPRDIKFDYDGADLTVNDCCITLKMGSSILRDDNFYAYQVIGNRQIGINAGLCYNGKYISYSATFDPSYDLVIDPLIHSSTFGGSGGENGVAIMLDASNDIYISGITNSADFPTIPGSYDNTANGDNDGYILKIDSSNGKVLYSTYIGGTGEDWIFSMALDTTANVYLTGQTKSSDFPTTPDAFDTTFNSSHSGLYNNGFIAKLNGNGTKLIFSTFIGGDSEDFCNSITVDSHNCSYVTGCTQSTDFLTTPGAFCNTYNYEDAFVLKLDSDGSNLKYSTLLGGTDFEEGNSIITDANGNCYVSGETRSPDFPVTAGAYDELFNNDQDCFVTELNPDGSGLVFSTFIGGISSDIPSQICLDNNLNIFMTGGTYSSDFPVTAGAFCQTYAGDWDTFVLDLASNGSSLIFSSFLAGQLHDEGSSIAFDIENNLYITGGTSSTDFPTTPGAYDTTNNGEYDLFLTIMTPDGSSLISSTYIGGNSYDLGNSVVVDAEYNAYITGYTVSPDFPIVNDSNRIFKTYGTGAVNIKLNSYPGVPQGLAGNATDSLVQLNWTEPEKPGEPKLSNYYIYKGTDATNLTLMFITDNMTVNDTQVTNGITYYYAVSAENRFGMGERSTIIPVIPGAPPTPPWNLTGRSSDRSVELRWYQPNETKGFPVLSYSILRGIDESSLIIIRTIGNVTDYNDSSVQNDIFYFYAIIALNSKGPSNVSNVVQANPGKLPSVPSNFVATPGYSYIALHWEVPQNDSNIIIFNYFIYRGFSENDLKLLAVVPNLDYCDTTVGNGIRYWYAISANGLRGEGPWSNVISATPGRAAGAPDLSVEAGDGVVSLSWNRPDDGGMKIISYNLYKGTSPSNLILLDTVNNQFYTDVKVTNGIIYYYQVSATNEKGEGKLSQLKSGTPYGRPGRVINLTVVGGDIFIIVSWSPPLDRIQYIKGYIVHKLNTQSGISLSFLTGDTIFYDDDVKNGVEYLYSVSAYTEKGECERGESIRAIPYTIPGPVTNLAQASGDRYVSLNWNAPVETGYSILQKYKIYRGVSKNTISFMTDTIDEFYNDTSVQNGITYFYRITAANQYKESPAAETNATPFSPPGPPEDFKLTGRGEQICLSWDYPLDAGGSMVFEYVVYRGKSRDSMKPVSVIKGYEYVDNATKNGNVNYYMVSARNMNGEGVPSDILTMETKSPSVSPSPQYILYLEVLILIILLLTIAFFYKRLQNLHEK